MTDQAYTPDQAHTYETELEHALPPEEARVWLETIKSFGLPEDARVLDFGAGTGVLVAVLKSAGMSVLGLEPSEHMVAEGLRLHPDLRRRDFMVGSGFENPTLGASSFDLIVSRQVLCHLRDPDQVFAHFHRWLRSGRSVLLVDGFWTSFSAEQKRAFPLADVEDPMTVAASLTAAGFKINRAGAYSELNEARRAALGNGAYRYVIAGNSA